MIERVNPNLSVSEKVRQLGEQILELNGKTIQGKFDINEIVQLFTDLVFNRKFLRNQLIGHLISDYTGWTHLKAETGYSIWKYSPTDYAYNSVNELYLDDILLENNGSASSESATGFDKVYLYDSTVYTDNTTEAGTETGTEFPLMDETDDYLYVGLSTTFSGIKFEFQTRGSGYDLITEYWNGASWVALSTSVYGLEDDTNNFESDGHISWTNPGDWATKSLFSGDTAKYYVRISTADVPITVAQAYYIIPSNSVISLLALSSENIIAGNWAWCSYNGSIYVTISNTGDGAFEGDKFITSSSTSANKQNFFVYNHTYKMNYEDDTFSASSINLVYAFTTVVFSQSPFTIDTESTLLCDAASGNITLNLPTAASASGRQIIIKKIDSSANTITIDAFGTQTIDGALTKVLINQYQSLAIACDGSNWHII